MSNSFDMDDLETFYGPNAGYVLDLYERYRKDPDSVDAETRAVFEKWTPPEIGATRGWRMNAPMMKQATTSRRGSPSADQFHTQERETSGYGSPVLSLRMSGALGRTGS